MMSLMTARTVNKIRHVPERSCSVCHAKSGKQNLIRIVKSPDGVAVVDIAKKLPGRGVYICPDSECVERARKSGILAGILKAETDENFWTALEEHIKSFSFNADLKLRSVLGLAKKSGSLLIGTDNIKKAAQRKILVLCATDCSENVRNVAAPYEHIILNLNTEELSRAVGSRGGVQILGLPLNSGFAKKILSLDF